MTFMMLYPIICPRKCWLTGRGEIGHGLFLRSFFLIIPPIQDNRFHLLLGTKFFFLQNEAVFPQFSVGTG